MLELFGKSQNQKSQNHSNTNSIEQVSTDIISGCKKGSRKAQEQFYRNYYKAMFTLCRRYTKNEDDAAEILNSSFLKVFMNIHRYEPSQASLYTWVRTIVVNGCIDFVKQKKRTEQSMELDEATEVYIDAEVINRMDVSRLLHLVRQLPPATQAVFNMYVLDGYNHREIGGLLGISEGTSKWHLSEARKNLQQILRQQEVRI